MKISVNHQIIEISGQRTLLEELRQAGLEIPSLCSDGENMHHASCMVCMVKDCQSGQMIPSCATRPREGMEIETDSEEIRRLRRISLELLLSDHRADCEAPCTLVCPQGIPVDRVVYLYDLGLKAQAKALVGGKDCSQCTKMPCQKACRRGSVDKSVRIRDIIGELIHDTSLPQGDHPAESCDKTLFNSRIGRFTEPEKERMKQQYSQPSRCLHCACQGRDKCRLRQLASQAGIKASRYGLSSQLPFKQEIHVNGRLWFEPAKCIRCGQCVHRTNNGFTFLGRGFGMQVIIPEQNKANIDEQIAACCPTGALYLKTEESC
ncbi:MAG: (2Fe-2S)-binding protein [Bacteroidales bacterium]|nr:(2Fe-2S)-binding protein [Bacteroidales bacterium]